MSSPSFATLLLFVGGEPDADTNSYRPVSFPARLASFVIPPRLILGVPNGRPHSETEPAWRWPPDQVMAAQLVVEAAAKTGRSVKIVDVNQPGDDRPLVERFVTANSVLPILVGSDLSRLEGIESFTASNLRRFLASI